MDIITSGSGSGRVAQFHLTPRHEVQRLAGGLRAPTVAVLGEAPQDDGKWSTQSKVLVGVVALFAVALWLDSRSTRK